MFSIKLMKSLLLTVLLGSAVAVLAQQSGPESSTTPPTQQADAQNGAVVPRPLTANDALKWKRLAGVTRSADGGWVAYQFSPIEGDSELIVRSLQGEKEYRYPVGETGNAGATFSHDGAWVVFATYPKHAEAEKLKKAKKGVQAGATLVNLASGEKYEYPKVRRFTFSGESSVALALHRHGSNGAAQAPPGGGNGSKGRPAPKGSDLIVRNLASGKELTIGGVSEFSFDKPGRWLAWTVTTDDQVGSGVVLRNLASGVVTTLDSDKARYERLSWSEEGDALAVLKGVEDKAFEEPLYSVMGLANLAASRPALHLAQYDPGKDEAFPDGMRISPNRAPSWSGDRKALLFGIDEAKKKDRQEKDSKDEEAAEEKKDDGETPPESAAGSAEEKDVKPAQPAAGRKKPDEEKPDLVIWHWKDDRLQSEQQVQQGRDRNLSFLAVWHVAEDRFVRLADEDLRDVSPPEKGRWAVGTQSEPYLLTGSLEGRRYQDVYMVDIMDGQRQLVGKRMRWVSGQSPDGSKLLYFTDGHYHVFDAMTGRSTNITRDVPVSFINVEDDHNVIDPPAPAAGWTADSRAVLLSDLWDVWRVGVDGRGAVNLTGNGREAQIRYRRYPLDRTEKGADFSKPQYFTMLGEWTKKGGVARLMPRRSRLEVLLWDDAAYGQLMKAENASTLLYTRATPTTYPDLYVADADLSGARRLSDGQAQLDAYTWSAGARLIDFESDSPRPELKGKKLQASLLLPAGYEPGRSYPTIVYIYEHLSDGMNRFAHPDVRGFNAALYTSNGYAVLMPDISYAINDPGMSAVWCVLPALRAAAATGIVDAQRVGLHGHSWGGYQTAFLVTQTDAFKAAIAGAPLTNMVSMYSLVYKNSGSGNMAIFESSQGRFSGGYWDHWDAYVRNSPITHAQDVNTPLIILHNDRDGAVDFTQGVEYYNTLRRLGKPVVMLEYVGENHGLAKPANKFDYTIRMQEYFDHYLKGASAPDWWTEGVRRLDMEEHLKARLPSALETQQAPAGKPAAQ